jgi:hypothetical protein
MTFTVPFPELAETATIAFTWDDLVTLEGEFGAGWYNKILDALDQYQPSVIGRLLEIGVDGGDSAEALSRLDTKTITTKIGDALMLRLRGQTIAELQAQRAKEKDQ